MEYKFVGPILDLLYKPIDMLYRRDCHKKEPPSI